MPPASHDDLTAIEGALSVPRIGTYLDAAGDNLRAALRLYAWNAQVSAALMVPSHFAEVVTRNAIAEALTAVYGHQWPWNPTLTRSLPSPKGGAYNPRRDLERTRTRETTTGKIIAELTFAFWQSMCTARHDHRVWDIQLPLVFPHADQRPARRLRAAIYADLDHIRRLRNRIAHHEPVYTRDLDDALDRMLRLITWRSPQTATWVRSLEQASALLANTPR